MSLPDWWTTDPEAPFQLGPRRFPGRIWTASGCFAYGLTGHDMKAAGFASPYSGLGAVVTKTVTPQPRPVELTAADRDAALDLLRSPNLTDRILADYEACGLVGEETNKLVCYLACVSRLQKQPLALLIQSGSAAGKTSLMDATLAFMPAEAQVRYSAMTGQSLYYMGHSDLKHKILAIAEEEGVAQASYALKLLQSDGKLRIAVAGKNSGTGRQQTETYEVEGPLMVFLTTTSETPDPELQNR